MDVAGIRLIDRYDFNSIVYGEAINNLILYRFVLPEWYYGSPSGEVTSQMPGENRVDGYDLRNQAVLDRITAADAKRKNTGKTRGEGIQTSRSAPTERKASPRCCRAKGRIEKRASTGMESRRAPAH